MQNAGSFFRSKWFAVAAIVIAVMFGIYAQGSRNTPSKSFDDLAEDEQVQAKWAAREAELAFQLPEGYQWNYQESYSRDEMLEWCSNTSGGNVTPLKLDDWGAEYYFWTSAVGVETDPHGFKEYMTGIRYDSEKGEWVGKVFAE